MNTGDGVLDTLLRRMSENPWQMPECDVSISRHHFMRLVGTNRPPWHPKFAPSQQFFGSQTIPFPHYSSTTIYHRHSPRTQLHASSRNAGNHLLRHRCPQWTKKSCQNVLELSSTAFKMQLPRSGKVACTLPKQITFSQNILHSILSSLGLTIWAPEEVGFWGHCGGDYLGGLLFWEIIIWEGGTTQIAGEFGESNHNMGGRSA